MPVVDEEAIQDAIKAYNRDEYPSIRQTAAAYGVDRKTLTRRLRGGNTRQQGKETQRLLSSAQEDLLVRWIIDLDVAGAAPNFSQIREFAGLISASSGGPTTIGENWIQRFLDRHDEIKSKVGRKIDYLRTTNTSPAALQTFFQLFSDVVRRHQILSMNIWNFDEVGNAIGLCSNQRVIGKADTKRSYTKTPENREWVTVVEACSATGAIIDPLVLFKGKELQSSWFPANTPSNWQFRCTENAFTSNSIGLAWLTEIFLPQTACGAQTRLLLCDNHGSHITVEFMYQCFLNNVQLVYMPPHSSHILQPLDIGVFSALKRHYRKDITNFARYDEIKPIERAQFIQFYAKARQHIFTPRYIESGWSGTGLYPFNPEKVLQSSQVIQLPPVQRTPPSNTSKRTSDIAFQTPTKGRQFQTVIRDRYRDIALDRDLRTIVGKTAKAIDQLTWENTSKSLEIRRLSVLLEQVRPTKRVKVALNSNQTFAAIEQIKEAQDRAQAFQAQWNKIDREEEAQIASIAIQRVEFISLCHEWQLSSNVVGDSEGG
jgi:hypothetical protein